MFKGFFDNYIFLVVLAFTVVIQFLLTQFGGAFASTHPLTLMQWGVCVAIGFIELPYGMNTITLNTGGRQSVLQFVRISKAGLCTQQNKAHCKTACLLKT